MSSLLIKHKLASQYTINCSGCGEVYEDPISDRVWLSAESGGKLPVRVSKEGPGEE